MRLKTLSGAALLAAAVVAALFAPAPPAGACSPIEPCLDVRGDIHLGQPVFEPLDVAEDALPPEWLDSEGTLHFNGYGFPFALALETADFQLSGAF